MLPPPFAFSLYYLLLASPLLHLLSYTLTFVFWTVALAAGPTKVMFQV